MRNQRRTIASIICTFALLVSLAGAQETKPSHSFVFSSGGGGHVIAGEPGHFAFTSQGDNTFVYVSTEMSLAEKLVKGVPYSAQAVTEHLQTLADGNRIVRRSTALLYRDSEGRTRREQTINAVGPYTAAGEPQTMIFINDPVAQVNYILDSKNRTARKMDLSATVGPEMRKKVARGALEKEIAVSEHKITERKIEIAKGGAFEMKMPPGVIVGTSMGVRNSINSKNTNEEALGKQTIEGVEAEGTRFTTTIQAGEIGNEAPIYIVRETWYSPELQTMIMTRQSDPRTGENTYRLTNINRSEPPHSLFELPADYTVNETVAPALRHKIETELRNARKKRVQ